MHIHHKMENLPVPPASPKNCIQNSKNGVQSIIVIIKQVFVSDRNNNKQLTKRVAK